MFSHPPYYGYLIKHNKKTMLRFFIKIIHYLNRIDIFNR